MSFKKQLLPFLPFSFPFASFALFAVQILLLFTACSGSTSEATPTPAGVAGPALLYFYTDN